MVKNELPAKCNRIVRESFGDFLMILRIPEVGVYLAKHIGEEVVTLNDVPMRTNQIYTLPVGSTFKFRNTVPIYHSEIVTTTSEILRGKQPAHFCGKGCVLQIQEWKYWAQTY